MDSVLLTAEALMDFMGAKDIMMTGEEIKEELIFLHRKGWIEFCRTWSLQRDHHRHGARRVVATALGSHGMTTLDQAIATTIVKARDALSAEALGIGWNYWIRLDWRYRVGSITANDHLTAFLQQLRATSHGIRCRAAIHADIPELVHAHLAVKLSRRQRLRFLNPTEFRDWLQMLWTHGDVFVTAFDNDRFHREHASGGGAIRYLARDPGSVVYG
jgi:hypothetical protein